MSARLLWLASVHICFVAWACAAQAQAASAIGPETGSIPLLGFDVAAIHESAPAGPYSQRMSDPPQAGSFDAVDMYASQIIAEAFGVNFRYQLSGGPEWMGQQRFVIHARSEAANDAVLAGLPLEDAKRAKQEMLQKLLADRFRFRGHVAVVDGPVYFLSVAGPSPNFHEAEVRGGEATRSGITTGGSPESLEMNGHGATMSQLAGLMSYYLRCEVIDQTGLGKTYDFAVRFNARPDLASDTHADTVPAEIAFPEQIGLKLVRGRGPVKMLVIDSLVKPSAN